VQSINEQYNCQLNLKIMAIHTKGTNFEKAGLFEKAIGEFRQGKQLVEKTLGTEHQFYVIFSSAMGGANHKWQTPTNVRKSRSRSNSPKDTKAKP
jgi:hypothetical protein